MPEKTFHTDLLPGDVGRYVLLPGAPERAKEIAQHFDSPRLVASKREFVTYTGTLEGIPVSVTSTGVGGPSASIAIEELIMAGADTMIRVGTCGGMQQDVLNGDLVIATGAIRAEGASAEYLPVSFPAVPHPQVLNALCAAAGDLGLRHHTGVVHCKDSFYCETEFHRMPMHEEIGARWRTWIAGGCLASEMETAVLYILGSIYRLRTGSVCLTVSNNEREAVGLVEPPVHDTTPAIRTAVEALRTLIRADRQNG